MAAIDTQLAELLSRNAALFASYEAWSDGQVMLLAGTADDPDSFDANGGKAGPLGHYPVVNVSGQTLYIPCIARLKAIAADGAAEIDAKTVAASAGAADAGKIVSLAADGRLDKSLLTGTKGFASVPQVVMGSDAPPASDSGSGTVAPLAPLQVVGVEATGFATEQHVVTGAHRKPARRLFVKTRGAHPSDFVRCAGGDGVVQDVIQAASGGQTAHVGVSTWYVDGPPEDGAFGEFPGQYSIDTGTGKQAGASPGYYGLRTAATFNKFQQTFLPGETFHRQVTAGTNGYFGFGANFGGILRLGPGGAAPGCAPLAIDGAKSTLLAVPEPYRVEYDAAGSWFISDSMARRRRIAVTDDAACAVAIAKGLGTAGGGATVTVADSGPNCGVLTLRVGADPSAGFELVTVTYPVAFAAMSVVTISPATATSATAGLYVQSTAAGFVILATGAVPANKNLQVAFTYRGR